MPISSSSQKIDEISKEGRALRAQSLSHPDKATEKIQDCLVKDSGQPERANCLSRRGA
jgi:hypothetical protein